MATKKEAEVKVETPVEEKSDRDFWNERVPVTIPFNQGNPEDQTYFVSVNDYSAQIQRGREVMVPRYVAAVIDQSMKAEAEAFMRRMSLSRQYEEDLMRI